MWSYLLRHTLCSCLGLSDGFTGVGNSLEQMVRAFKLDYKISFTFLVFLLFSSNQIAGFLHQQCLHEESIDLASFLHADSHYKKKKLRNSLCMGLVVFAKLPKYGLKSLEHAEYCLRSLFDSVKISLPWKVKIITLN